MSFNPEKPVPRKAIYGWMMFDMACQPFFTLITTFIFAPYFVARLSPDPSSGQALWGYATALAGLVLAVLSPVLGSVSDATGAKKPWIAGCVAVLAFCCSLLWFADPVFSYAMPLALFAFAVGTIAAEIAVVFNNAMMPRLVPLAEMGRLSGRGWALGYAGGLVSLIIILGLLAANPETGKTFFGIMPLFGLNPLKFEGDRITGPLSALWLIVFAVPMFLWTPDLQNSGRTMGQSVKVGLKNLQETWQESRQIPGIKAFLIANLIYQDGLVALFAFGGLYGAGVFGWGTTELGIFGILLTVTGMIGAYMGGAIDDHLGPLPVIKVSLLLLSFVCIGILSLGKDYVLFVVPVSPTGEGLFAGIAEKIFVGLGLVIGAVAGPLQAASRTLLVHLVPHDRVGRYFGFLALSGKVTSFVGPLLVALATDYYNSQSAGPAVLILFFVGGFLILRKV